MTHPSNIEHEQECPECIEFWKYQNEMAEDLERLIAKYALKEEVSRLRLWQRFWAGRRAIPNY